MSLLKRLLSSGLRPRPPAPAAVTPPAAPGRPAAPAPAPTPQSLAREIEALRAGGDTRAAAKRFVASMSTPPATPEAAAWQVEHIGVPLLQACLGNGDSDSACRLEAYVYGHLIKHFEDPAHYERCFAAIDGVLHAIGRRRAGTPPPAAPLPARRLLFFFHNMKDELAHLVLLADVLDAHLAGDPSDAVAIGVVGVTDAEPAPRLRALRDRHGIALHALPPGATETVYDQALDVMRAEGYDRLVVVAAPIGLSYLSGRLGTGALAWWSMKFELGCFEHLDVRCSFVSGYRRERQVNGRTWHEAAPLMAVERIAPSGTPQPTVALARQRHATLFYSINREEKIRNPLFLDMVARVLEAVPDAGFIWTGRNAPPEVDAFFAQRGLGDRHHFAGWVTPDDLVAGADIFLDTPVLSGTVAARAALDGRPVVTLAESHSWMNFFWPAWQAQAAQFQGSELAQAIASIEAAGLHLESPDPEQYVEQAVRLARDPALRREYGHAVGLFARRYYLSSATAAADHLHNLRSDPARP